MDHSNVNTVFYTVIVVTGRRILDTQIRNNVKQFEQVKGVVKPLQKAVSNKKLHCKRAKEILLLPFKSFLTW